MADHNAKTYTMINPQGKEETFTNMATFCKNNDLCISTMGKVYRGIMAQYRGWKSTNKAYQAKFTGQVKRKSKKKYVFTNPKGEKFEFENMKIFCRDHGLVEQSMVRVNNLIILEHKGWKKFTAEDLFKLAMRA